MGDGNSPEPGDAVAVHYSLYYNGIEVETTRDGGGLAARPQGFEFGVMRGPGSFNNGVQIGMKGMMVGGQRLITVPPALAFGEKGLKPLIPPNATVEFAVSLMSCKKAGTNVNSMLGGKKSSVF
mmetsp:Transcript_10059/g.26401  ORF Transcript_10059/g.26401 Transcript_10059/m.26401 type:complete len:124 (+) Transcript_10059:102-473(+)